MRSSLASLGLLALAALGGCSSVASTVITLQSGKSIAAAFLDPGNKTVPTGVVVLSDNQQTTKDCREDQPAGLVPWVIHYDAYGKVIQYQLLTVTPLHMSAAEGHKFLLVCGEAAHTNLPTEVTTSVAP
jgi:hypothetical protein